MDNSDKQNSPLMAEPQKKSATVKLLVTLAAFLVVGGVVWAISSRGDESPAVVPAEPNQSQAEDGSQAAPAADASQPPADNQPAADDNTVSQQPPAAGNQDPGGSQPPAAQTPDTPAANQNPGSQPPAAAGQYVVYQNQAQLDQLAGSDRWLNFHADWCPYCVHLDGDINDNLDQIPSGVTIVKIDFDKNQDLRVRYGVNRQTTIVRIDASGNEVDRFVGYGRFASLDSLASAFGY